MTQAPGFSGDAIVDIALDDIRDNGAYPDARSSIVPGLQYAEHSGKGHVKAADGCSQPESTPSLLFVAAGDTGKVDVIEIKTGGILKTLNTPGVTCLAQYWRQ